MATFQFTIPDPILTRVADALHASYPDLVPANTPAVVAIAAVLRFVIRSHVVSFEVEKKRKDVEAATGDAAAAAWSATEGIG